MTAIVPGMVALLGASVIIVTVWPLSAPRSLVVYAGAALIVVVVALAIGATS